MFTYEVTREAVNLELFPQNEPRASSVCYGRLVLIMVEYYILSESLIAITDMYQTVFRSIAIMFKTYNL